MARGDASRFTRRIFLKRATTALMAGSALLAACSSKQSTPPPSTSSTSTTPVSGATPTKAAAVGAASPTVAPTIPPRQLKQVPRNRTLILRWGGTEGQHQDWNLWNPYNLGANHQNGPGIFYEPLAYYSAFADKMIPWLATSWQYTPDYKQLTIKLRSGIKWSDGQPFTAEDVAFTFNTLRDLGPKVRWGVDVQQFVDEAKALDDTTVQINFKIPAPRFFYFVTYKYDIGVYIVPKHIFQGQDWSTFTAFDLDKDWPVTTGPWKVVYSSPQQKVIDRRDSWWAVDQGLVKAMPQVERIIYLPFTSEEQVAQQLISNDVDCSLDLRPLTIETVLQQNPKIITHTYKDPPYGYEDWWPTSLYVNCEREPYNDKDVRWALSYFIDRKQLIEVALGGAGEPAVLPMPTYPGLLPYFDAVKDLLQQYPTNEFNPQKGAQLLQSKGWQKNKDGFWEKNGKVLEVPMESFTVMADIGPVIAEQLRRQGVQSSYNMPPDFDTRFNQGDYNAALYGHGGSIGVDPYFTLRLYQSKTEAVPGAHQVNFSRWHNDQFDKIVDEMAVTPPEQKDKIMDQWKRAMQIWLPELPDIPIQKWFHRIPMNTTYWQGWPTRDNPYVNGAFWHLTFQLILNELKPTQ